MRESQIKAAIQCIQASLKLIAEGKLEDVIRHNFTSYLRLIFPEVPSWVKLHIEGGESAVHFSKNGQTRIGFVDNLVDLTVIEYESNLTIQGKFETGFGQVKDYCASLINKGHDPELILGVLSDTVRWRAYKIKSVSSPVSGKLGREHIELEEIEYIDLSAADEVAARKLINFLNTYLGRLGSRPLTASSIAKDFGFDSEFCSRHTYALRYLVQEAFASRPQYAKLISDLWCRFVSYLRDKTAMESFDKDTYADELYILTLAKLVCANIIERKALLSDDSELRSILQGGFFKTKGLSNLVEYDYFGWINEGDFLDQLLPIARALQEDLKAYDFSKVPAEDLFGQMMAQLAKRSQRLLLGQEWTPSWLARLIVNHVISKLPADEYPKLVDMCCGSGAMIVEGVKLTKARIMGDGEELASDKKLQLISEAITGFDIDPLAVMLSKISWVLAARDWLEPFGTFTVTIPIYHADSLFAITPLSEAIEDEGEEFYKLKIADSEIQLPCFLISPEFQSAFDSILDIGYEMAMSLDSKSTLDEEVLNDVINNVLSYSGVEIDSTQRESVKRFLNDFIITVARLNREGQNGIWAFILRNSYRPGLVAGQFNGLVSNPPWLALSKIADNPYQDVLKTKAEQFGIKPPGPSFLHIEMATIFLLHAVDRYLRPEAVVGCITPETVLNGYHHQPFRAAKFVESERSVYFSLEEIWRVEEHTFKNKGIVLFGRKAKQRAELPDPIPGALASETGLAERIFYRNVQGKRSAWSEQKLSKIEGFFSPANFKQGADIMPRTLFFHEVIASPPHRGKQQWSVRPIDRNTSSISFVIKDAKNYKDFKITPCVLPDDLFFDVLTSNLLTPFDLAEPVKALLPIRKSDSGTWEPLSRVALAAKGASASAVFRQICEAIGPEADIDLLWEQKINMRNKLSQQIIKPTGYLVFTGTSGGIVCSAFKKADLFNLDKIIVDQTLNWAQVETLHEAIYLTGLFNSQAINQIIQDFQPEGALGKRHIHSLPFGVTPPYDETQAAHQEVVKQTMCLIGEYEKAKEGDPELLAVLDPNRGTLARRRSIISAKIRQLPSYQNYALACRNLYGV
ncbi:N-6 DNA methylase [Aneurinibacillus sp. UBA3580]|jgi:hypothetical protein|uniref:N-6 DNA methylase n=1 Tax=Aneurinibacillus sp. UBA3580 TaxID=1946041 RepID=UPI002579A4F8|nr:N-6 DNA methylase [Aneurinibacillus sp. UBA3580]